MIRATVFCLAISQLPVVPSSIDRLTFCDDRDSTMCVRPLAKDEPAPWSGELMTLPLALKLKQDDQTAQERCDAAMKMAKADLKIELSRVEGLRDAESMAHQQVMNQCVSTVEKQAQAIKDAQPPWYTRPWFVAPMTALLTGGIMGWALTR